MTPLPMAVRQGDRPVSGRRDVPEVRAQDPRDQARGQGAATHARHEQHGVGEEHGYALDGGQSRGRGADDQSDGRNQNGGNALPFKAVSEFTERLMPETL
jgi:hypothetical protein